MIRRRPKPAGSTAPKPTGHNNNISGVNPLTASIIAGLIVIGSAAGASTTAPRARRHVATSKSRVAQSTSPATAPPTVPSAPVAPSTTLVPPTPPVPSTPGMPVVPGSAEAGASPLPDVTIPTPPAVTVPGVPPVTITLDQAVATALNNNTAIALARERLKKAQEQIKQGYAEALPQIGASVSDTYSSQKSFSAAGGATGTNVALPGGGVIPVIVDQGGASAGTFFAGGGGGNATGAGQPSTTGGSPASGGGISPVSGGSGGTAVPSGTTTGPGSTGTGTDTGTGGSGSGQSAPGPSSMVAFAGPRSGASTENAGLPPILQQYSTAQQLPRSVPVGAQALQAHAASGNNSGNFSTGGHNNYAARVSVNQDIDIFGLVPASLDVLRRTRDFYAIDLNRISNELALTVKNEYFTVLRDQANVAADEEQARSAAENVRITTAKYNAGQAARFDVLTAQTTLANDNQALIAAQNQAAIDQANLNSLLGISLDQPVTVTTPPLPPLDQTIDLPAAVSTAYAHRPELMQAENNIAIARRLVRLSGAGLLPSLSISGDANYNGPHYPGVNQDNYTVTANLAIPLYDGGATASKVRSAESDLRSQIITREQLRQNVTLEVRQAYLDTMSARSAVAAAQVGVAQAADAARLAEVRFRTGVGTFLDVINAEAQLATARTNLATAEFQYQTSLASLTRAEGGR